MANGVQETQAYLGPEGVVVKQDCPSGVQYYCSFGGKRHYAGSVRGCLSWLRKRRATQDARRALSK